jgi:4-amino-4-deoxy-L-arabinose transferase-like glycosyltransferase
MGKRVNDSWARQYRWWMTGILLIGAGLRLVGLDNFSPPGLAHDEVAHWLINRDILAGNHAIYFTDAYGHEAAFHYFQTLFMLLLGDNALALRLPSAFSGLLLVAVTFALGRRLFGLKMGLFAAALGAVLLWPVFYSRQAVRAISLPLVAGISAYLWWDGWHKRSLWQSLWRFTAAGLWAGLSLHTYMAARAVPIFYGLFILYLALFHREQLRQRWRGVLLFSLAALMIAAPLAHFLMTNPGAEVRVVEVSAPLTALRDGDWRPVVSNSLLIAGMFGPTGDPLWRQNVAGQPVFDPLTAVIFYLGVLIFLWHWRDSRYAFVLLWALTATIPSIVTINAPSYIRIVNMLPVLGLFPGIVIHSLLTLSPDLTPLSTVFRRYVGLSMAMLAILLAIGLTIQAIFRVWPAHDEVQFVWQEGLTAIARHLDETPAIRGAAIAGWSPDSMDPPTMALKVRRSDLALRYFEPSRTLLLPAEEPVIILRPAILPLDPYLERYLLDWGAAVQPADSLVQYTLSRPSPQPEYPTPATFGGELRFLGYDRASSCDPATSCQLISFWQVVQPQLEQRRLFMHLLTSEEIAALNAQSEPVQDDGLESNPAYWQPGDLLLYRHNLFIPAQGAYWLHLGVYDPSSGRRLLTEEGQEFLRLPLLIWSNPAE